MDITTHAPVKIFLGNESLETGKDLFALGKKALVVTGRHSADACGVMADLDAILMSLAIPYVRFNRITENPMAETCHEGGRFCRDNGCDFIIAAGGGSVLDGAKAIAAYAANPDADVLDIYDSEKVPDPSLPLIAIPTTAGTGSEAVPYAVLTLPGGLKKKTFKSATSWPKYSFVCPKYTYSMNRDTSVSTALDALAHAMESYLSPKSTEDSQSAAVFAAREVWDVLFLDKDGAGERDAGGFTPKQRQRLAYAATAAGVAISYTGTGFPHPLGYSLTLTYGIPHGKACAIFEGAYIRYNRLNKVGKNAIDELAVALDTTVEEMALRIPAMSGLTDLTMTAEKAEELIDLVAGAGNYANSPYVISRGEMSDIYKRLFVK